MLVKKVRNSTLAGNQRMHANSKNSTMALIRNSSAVARRIDRGAGTCAADAAVSFFVMPRLVVNGSENRGTTEGVGSRFRQSALPMKKLLSETTPDPIISRHHLTQ